MNSRPSTVEEAAQARGEARLAPHLTAISSTIAWLCRTLFLNNSELVLVLPESEWADVKPAERAVMVLGCAVVHADVPAPMVAIRARTVATIPPIPVRFRDGPPPT